MAAGTGRRRPAPVMVGTSGFSYPAWRGPFYPADLPVRRMLAYYATVFRTVEINLTFQRFPTRALLDAWRKETPAGFRFALKAPQTITHRRRLRDCGDAVRDFATATAALGTQRGPILFQLPPNFRADHDRLAAFLADVPRDVDAAFEFRHESWFTDETWALLRAHRAALCIADAEDLATPWVATGAFGYLRLRRDDYDGRALDGWAARIRAERGWRRTFVYLKHEETARGPALARALLERLGGST